MILLSIGKLNLQAKQQDVLNELQHRLRDMQTEMEVSDRLLRRVTVLLNAHREFDLEGDGVVDKGVLAALDRLGKDKPAGALVADLAAGKTAP